MTISFGIKLLSILTLICISSAAPSNNYRIVRYIQYNPQNGSTPDHHLLSMSFSTTNIVAQKVPFTYYSTEKLMVSHSKQYPPTSSAFPRTMQAEVDGTIPGKSLRFFIPDFEGNLNNHTYYVLFDIKCTSISTVDVKLKTFECEEKLNDFTKGLSSTYFYYTSTQGYVGKAGNTAFFSDSNLVDIFTGAQFYSAVCD